MTTNAGTEALLDAAIDVLTRRLPSTWTVEKQPSTLGDGAADLIIGSQSLGSQTLVLVEVKSKVTPRDVEALIGGPWRRWRPRLSQPILLVSRYISPRVRELLTEENVNYVDVAGNIRVSLDYPAVFIDVEGSNKDPNSKRPRTAIRGAKAGAVVRALIDAAPPNTAAEIAKAASVNEGYLSRILDALVGEGLIDKERAGPVTWVDWPSLLRRRAQALDLFRPNGSYRYVAREGASALLDRLRSRTAVDGTAPTVTGSFAAARLAPVAAPSLLVLYVMDARALASELDLFPAESGADTVMIQPDNNVAFARSVREGGVAWAAPSQIAIDCLSGAGRMPSEGDALIDWMRENERDWRYPSMQALMADATELED